METDSNYVPRVYVLSLIMSSQRRMTSTRGMKRAIVTKLVKIEFLVIGCDDGKTQEARSRLIRSDHSLLSYLSVRVAVQV